MKKGTFIQYSQLILTLCIISGFLSCSPQDNTYAGGGIGGTGVISTGTVTEIGSIWVNEIEYDTENADIYINDELIGNGNQAVIDNLNPGHVVVVNGKKNKDNTGQADSVFYASTLLGPIDDIDIIDDNNRIFHILGQEVLISGETVIIGSIDDYSIGNLVEISGYIDDVQNIQASYISKKSDITLPTDLLRVTGIINGLDENDKTFKINDLSVDYASAELAGNLRDNMEDGLWVHVSGYLEDGNPDFMADKVRPFNRLEEHDGLEIEIEGIISSDLLDNTFGLDGYLVEITGATKFIGGSTEELLAGARVEVEGTFSADILMADTIKFKTTFTAESNLASKDGNILRLSGLDELTVYVNDATKYNGLNKSFDELAAGDHITVRGWITSEDILMATMVTSTAVGNNKVYLQGQISDISDPENTITIHTVEIDTDLIPSDGFFNEDETPISQATFLDIVAVGDTATAKGDLIIDSVSWSTLTLQEP